MLKIKYRIDLDSVWADAVFCNAVDKQLDRRGRNCSIEGHSPFWYLFFYGHCNFRTTFDYNFINVFEIIFPYLLEKHSSQVNFGPAIESQDQVLCRVRSKQVRLEHTQAHPKSKSNG